MHIRIAVSPTAGKENATDFATSRLADHRNTLQEQATAMTTPKSPQVGEANCKSPPTDRQIEYVERLCMAKGYENEVKAYR